MAMFISVWVPRNVSPTVHGGEPEETKTKEELKQLKKNNDLVCSLLRWIQLYHELGTEEIQGFEFTARYPRTCLTTHEAQLLSKQRKRPMIVIGWVLDAVARNRVSFKCADPILGRIYSLASDANTQFNECRRVRNF